MKESKNGLMMEIHSEITSGKITEKMGRDILNIYSDPGRFAAMKGYDAIRITFPNDITPDYIVILNRGKVIVKM